MAILKVEENAPNFTLSDQKDEEFTLFDFEGRKVLLSFHPLAWTRICALQMKSLEDNYLRLGKLNTVPVGISVDAVPTKEAWAEDLEIENTRLLSDFWPHGEVAKLYGIFSELKGFSKRANVLVDETGVIEFSKKYPISEVPDIEEIIEFLEQ